jgi:putative phosphoesterase
MRYPSLATMTRSPRSKYVHRSERLEVPADRPLRVAIVSDTHSEPHPKSLPLVARQEPDAILHGGDIGALEVLDALGAIAPVYAVRGNIDTRDDGLADSIDLTLASASGASLTLLLTHVAVYGPRLRADVAKLAAKHDARLVVCGHSHVPFLGRDRGIVLFNPGSIGPRRPPLPITMGLMQVGATISLRHLDCETGQPWQPGP